MPSPYINSVCQYSTAFRTIKFTVIGLITSYVSWYQQSQRGQVRCRTFMSKVHLESVYFFKNLYSTGLNYRKYKGNGGIFIQN
jgi:hypothetical protein